MQHWIWRKYPAGLVTSRQLSWCRSCRWLFQFESPEESEPYYGPMRPHLKWLLDSDPAIRWQVMRDLSGEAPEAIAAERSRIATEGWGAQLLAAQSPAGDWGVGPKWDLITLFSLVVLKDLGLDPASK